MSEQTGQTGGYFIIFKDSVWLELVADAYQKDGVYYVFTKEGARVAQILSTEVSAIVNSPSLHRSGKFKD